MSDTLERALVGAGIDVRVETRDRLAVLIPCDDGSGLMNAPVRRAAIALAAERGFTHVALELVD